MSKKAAVLLLVVLALVLSVPAKAMITFSEFDLGTVVTSQYAPQGVLFSAASYNAPVISGNLAMPDPPVLRPDGGPGTYQGDFWFEFITPVDWLQFDSGYWNAVGTAAIDLYAPGGGLIVNATNSLVGVETLTFSGLGPIKKVYFNSVADEFGGDLDNLDFTPVPEPATLTVIGLGLLGICGLVKRRRA